MTNKKAAFFYIIIFIFGILLSCSSNDTSSVTIRINLGLQKEKSVSYEKSIIDKILNIFETKAFAQTAPSNLTSLVLNVTGSGMDTITQQFTDTFPSEITLSVPAGSGRLFEVLAYTPSATLRGAVTRDLSPGAVVDIPIDMGLYETKIVIPDPQGSFGTPRLCQIDDISGGWTTPLTAVSGVTYFKPYDVDFDTQGRIYFANNYASTGGDYIVRIDDINGGNPLLLGANGSGYNAIAIDRRNNIIYSARSGVNTLWQCDIGNTTFNQIILTGKTFTAIRGLAVDDDGNLYIAATTSGPVYEVIKWTPPNLTNFISYSTNLAEPWDVLVTENSLYITNRDGADGYKIIRLDLSLNLLGNTGNQSTSQDSVPNNFYGPKRFLAILNRGLFIIDEASQNEGDPFSGLPGDRLVYFDDISLNGWQTFGSTGTGDNQFNFFWEC